jgi:hypothetical protein
MQLCSQVLIRLVAFEETISKASPLLSSFSLLASSEGAACNDAGTAWLVEAARMEERGCVQRCLSNPLNLRGEAMLQIVIDVFGHGAQLQGIKHCSRKLFLFVISLPCCCLLPLRIACQEANAATIISIHKHR